MTGHLGEGRQGQVWTSPGQELLHTARIILFLRSRVPVGSSEFLQPRRKP